MHDIGRTIKKAYAPGITIRELANIGGSARLASYFLDEVPKDGVYEVHVEQCPNLPDKYHLLYIGEYPNSRLALKKAERIKTCVSLCPSCGDRNKRPQVIISYRRAS